MVSLYQVKTRNLLSLSLLKTRNLADSLVKTRNLLPLYQVKTYNAKGHPAQSLDFSITWCLSMTFDF